MKIPLHGCLAWLTTISFYHFTEVVAEGNFIEDQVCVWWKNPGLKGRYRLHQCSLNPIRNLTAIGSESRVFRDVNLNRPLNDLDNFKIKWGSSEEYQQGRLIGTGKYAEVYLATHLKTKRVYVAKVIKASDPESELKIKREVKVLENLRGGPNIVKLETVVKVHKSPNTALILEYVQNKTYKRLSHSFTDLDVRFYAYELLKALNYSHSMGIMHRDIKPQNVLIDHEKGQLRVIDWGRAKYYRPGQNYSVKVATRQYKPPELLVGYQMYDYSLDMWSFGCVLACMIFQKFPFFNSSTDDEQLSKVVQILGTDGLFDYLEKYQIQLNSTLDNLLEMYPKKPWEQFVNKQNKHLISSVALDLVDKLLRYDHQERLTAMEAMDHPYFYPIVRPHKKRTYKKKIVKANEEQPKFTMPGFGKPGKTCAKEHTFGLFKFLGEMMKVKHDKTFGRL